ncbi:type 1 glutamine amidotransferase [Williamsia herbipolensis]|uniref:type 1 glutamine amidotransferase n=1 Tax=Williamsia herbipolensis TaxID=1603258 RepID=UPI0005F877C8|nr:type 1 glutamine amidotransferase [Williamsia herbipolensis]
MTTALFLAHEDDRERGRVEAGSLADNTRARGYDVVVAHPGDDLPDPTSIDFVTVLGSAHAADDDSLPWLAPERAYVAAVLDAGTPVLGVCFGGQLLSRVLGGVVTRSPHPEVGFATVESTRDFIDSGPWMQWHFDHFTVPPGAELIAHNPNGAQAFVSGRNLGLQFHPEISAGSFAAWRLGWTRESEIEVERDFGIDVDDLADRIARDAANLSSRCGRLLDGFLAL